MACEVASSPFSEHTIDEGWMKTTDSGNGFDALVEFNAAFGGNGHNTVDPHMLSNPPSPANNFNSDFNVSGLDQTLRPEANNGLGIHSHDFAKTQAPYYSIEHQHPGSSSVFASSSIRHEFRRSVSEPPDGLPLHHHQMQNPGPQISFNRNGHFIGHMQQPQLQRLKSLPKARQTRSQPYKTKTSGHQQQRYSLRRAQTQPTRQYIAPTSTPTITPAIMEPLSSYPYPAALGHGMSPTHDISQHMFESLPAVPEQRSYISSRVCTPAPEEMFSPQAIDPMLTAPPTPSHGNAGDSQGQGVRVAMTVEQLRSMITEAVQKAVGGLGGKNGASAPAGDAEVAVEMVVQSVEEEKARAGLTEGGQTDGEDRQVMKVHRSGQSATHGSGDDWTGFFVE